ncbi:ribonuclease P protein subunit p30 [Pogonomyrmex barbatus]|uniref:Ribonuclease P protein subunit p30 n=1 Tax=Pogonomyrmex barbatus TaxID=144034 RepID=A0A6I9WBP7_9HYME|nr:ribonuclease P protein subunit p30 [Pogonomyrmex barbatus]
MDFKLSDGFFDLCINIPDKRVESLDGILLKLYEMGYRTIALNHILNENDIDSKKKKEGEKTKVVSNVVPNPIDISKLNEKWKGKLRILNRITFICSDSTKAHTLALAPNLKKYDIYAIVPTNQNILEFACSQIKADLITIKPEISGIKINRKVYRQAIARGLCFETQYVDLLKQETRIAALHSSYKLHMYRGNVNVIISSGANSKNLIRSPYDIINLGFILGLNRDRIKPAILDECQLVLLRARRRISGKSVFTIEFAGESKIDDDDNDDDDDDDEEDSEKETTKD